ncbi:hypothetical protein ES705_38383 [subsurface metagenome]
MEVSTIAFALLLMAAVAVVAVVAYSRLQKRFPVLPGVTS